MSYQLLSDACEAVEKQTELENFPDKMVAVIDHIIEALRKDTLVLKFLEHNFIWPGLDQIEASFFREPVNHLIRLHFAKKDETLNEALNRLQDIRKKIPVRK